MKLHPGAAVSLGLIVLLLAACLRSTPAPTLSELVPAGVSSASLFVEPDDGVRPVVEFIDRAQRSLDVAMYLLSDRAVINALEARQRHGVQVRVMLEENPYGTGPGNRSAYDQLRGAGVAVRWSPATFRLSHDKYAIADRRVALIGTANWTRSAFVDNREYLVLDSDPSDVGQLTDLFEADWNRQTARIDDPHLVVSPVNSRADFLALIGSAQHAIHLEAEEMQDGQIEGALVDAARRGVEVEVVLPRSASSGDPNLPGRQRLVAGGVQVHQLEHPHVHAKDIIVDRREAFVGSQNISPSSLDDNREIGVIIADPGAVQRLEETFRRDWQAGQP